MKKCIIIIFCILFLHVVVGSANISSAVAAQDEVSEPETRAETLSKQDKEGKFPEEAYNIYEELNKALALGELAESSKVEIIDNFAPALIGEWSYFAIDNAILAESKFIDNPVKVYDLTIANEQRIYNVSFTYFPEEKQIYYTRKEYINSSAENVLLALDEAKKDDELNLKFESAATHFFERENYADYLTVKIADVSGMISFVNSGIINVKFKTQKTKEKVNDAETRIEIQTSALEDTAKIKNVDIEEPEEY